MLEFVGSYFFWHFTRAYSELFMFCKNISWFFYNFFSVSVLIRTLFYPWQRLDEGYKGGFDLESMFSTFVVNSIMRVLGFFIRSFVIIIGLLFILIWFFVSIGIFILWTLFPFLVIFFLVSGIKLFVS